MKFLKCYKEIWFGIGLGAFAWVVDAVMHVELGADVHAGGLWSEIFAPHPTAFIFRVFYFVVAVAFGVSTGHPQLNDFSSYPSMQDPATGYGDPPAYPPVQPFGQSITGVVQPRVSASTLPKCVLMLGSWR